MKKRHIILLLVLLSVSVAVFAKDINSTTAIGFHAGTQSGSGYSMRFMGERHGLQLTLGAITYGNDNVYFEEEYYNWDGDYIEEIPVYGPKAPGDTITVPKIGRITAANFGLNYIYTLDKFNVFRHDDGRLYVMAGGSYTYYRKNVFTKDYERAYPDSTDGYYDRIYNAIDDTEEKTSSLEHHWTAGAGLGAEIALSKQFKIALELPITYNWENRIVMYIPQIGIYYYFK